MKKVLFAFGIIAASAIGANAQDTSSAGSGSGSSQYNTEAQSQGSDSQEYTEKEVIAADELPALVREQVQGSDYSGWTMGEAYRKEKDGQTYYAVKLQKDGETKIVKFDAQGNKIKEKDADEMKKK